MIMIKIHASESFWNVDVKAGNVGGLVKRLKRLLFVDFAPIYGYSMGFVRRVVV